MSAKENWARLLLAFGLHASATAMLWLMSPSAALELALFVLSVLILILAAHLGLAIAGHNGLAYLPIGLLMSMALGHFPEGFSPTVFGQVAILPVTALVAAAGLALADRLAFRWRGAAVAGCSMVAGAWIIQALPELQVAKSQLPTPQGWSAIEGLSAPQSMLTLLPALRGWPAVIVAATLLVLALLVYFRLRNSTGAIALNLAHDRTDLVDVLAIPVESLRWRIVLVAGLIAGLAGIVLAPLAATQPGIDWPAVWFGMTIAVLIAGSHSLGDAWLAAFPILTASRTLTLLDIGLPDLTWTLAIATLIAAILMHPGYLPGDRNKANPSRISEGRSKPSSAPIPSQVVVRGKNQGGTSL